MRLSKPLLALLRAYHALLLLYWMLRALGAAWSPLALLHNFALWLTLPTLLSVPLVAWGQRRLPLAGLVGLACGAWLAAPYLVPRADVPSRAPTFTLISYNIWAYNPRFAAAVTWLASQDVDAVVLLEVDHEGVDPRLAPLLARYPYEARIDGSVRIFARTPFTSQRVIALETLDESPEPRLILRVTLRWQGEEIVLYGVHLSLPEADADTFPDLNVWARVLLGYNETRRNRQIARVVGMAAAERAPTLLAGDFNASATSPVILAARQQLTDSWLTAGAGCGATYPVWQSLGVSLPLPALLRIDYVWHNAGWRARAAALGDAHGSDHLPLIVTLERSAP